MKRKSAFVVTKSSSGVKINLAMSCGACVHGDDTMSSPRSPCLSCLRGDGASKFKLAPEYKKCRVEEVEQEMGD